jgi:AraC-like DNA-binding protein
MVKSFDHLSARVLLEARVTLREEHKAAVERMLRYIDDHLNQSITLHQLAEVAQYSPWHSARMFKEATGMAPFTYLRHRRLSEAARRLESPETKVVDVAFDFVFDSHEGFTRAFSRQFGVNPMEFRRIWAAHVTNRVSRRYTSMAKKDEGDTVMKTVFVQVVERPARKAIVKSAQTATDYFSYCEEVGCDVWEVLSSVKKALYEPVGMWMPENLRRIGTGEYMQGVEVPFEYKGDVPEGFDMIELPPCKMMVFQGPPFEDEDYEEAISGLWDVMKSYDPTFYGFAWADSDGPRFQMEPLGYRGYIEARPCRSIG